MTFEEFLSTTCGKTADLENERYRPCPLARCAYHEAGNATAALTLGIPIITVTIENDRPHLVKALVQAAMAVLVLVGAT